MYFRLVHITCSFDIELFYYVGGNRGIVLALTEVRILFYLAQKTK